jgi:hypothetical protein
MTKDQIISLACAKAKRIKTEVQTNKNYDSSDRLHVLSLNLLDAKQVNDNKRVYSLSIRLINL